MKKIKKVLAFLVKVAVVVLLLSWCVSCCKYVTYKNVVTYELDEIEEGVYGYYNATASAIPAENYEMITLYFAGRIYTLDGNVKIHYTNDTPKIVWTDINVVHGDTFEVYVPEGSIIIRPNVNIA